LCGDDRQIVSDQKQSEKTAVAQIGARLLESIVDSWQNGPAVRDLVKFLRRPRRTRSDP